MKIRLEVCRENLPPVKILWTTAGLRPGSGGPSQCTTIAQLLYQVNEVIPLENDVFGLEDYVAEVNGYECLHFAILEEVLEENVELR